MDNKKYTVEQLLHNPSFIRWAKGDASWQEAAHWNQWVKASEQNRSIALEAQQKIAGFTFETPELPEVQKEWNRVRKDIARKESPPKLRKLPADSEQDMLTVFLKVAAVLLVGAFVGVAAYMYQQSPTDAQEIAVHTTQTRYGEKQTISLSDGSTIILGAKSTLSYKENWLEQPVKRVHLQGEAFFSISPQKTEDHPKFVVETEDGSAAVWGTRFTVNTHGAGSRVVLEEGEVRVNARQAANEVMIQPGQMASFSKRDTTVAIKNVNPRVYTSWTTNKLFFDNTPLSVLIERIKQTYGLDVKIRDDEILQKRLSGSVDFRTLDGLVTSVSEVLDIQINKTGNILIITQN